MHQVHSFLVCHGNITKEVSHFSENLSISRFFVKSSFSFVVTKPRYSLRCFSLGWIFVSAFALLRCGAIVQVSLFFSPYFMMNRLIPNYDSYFIVASTP